MNFANEDALLAYLKTGNSDAFELCYRQYRGLLAGWAFVHLKDETAAKDMVQDLFADLWHNQSFNAVTGSLSGFLFAAIKNRCLNQLKKDVTRRKHIRRITPEAPDDPADHRLERDQQWEEFSEKIRSMLSPQTYKVVFLTYFQGLNRKEVAAVTGMSPNTVRNHLVKALKIIRRNFGSDSPNAG